MALAAGERLGAGGYVFNTSGYLVVTTSTAGASMSGGLLRDPDRRLVVVYQ